MPRRWLSLRTSLPAGKHGADGEHGWRAGLSSSNAINFATSHTGNTTNYNSATTAGSAVSAGEWMHLVYVYDKTYLRVYKNGSEVTSGDFPYASAGVKGDSTAEFTISKSDFGAYYWDGYIDEAFLMDRDLSASEVSDIYTNGLE